MPTLETSVSSALYAYIAVLVFLSALRKRKREAHVPTFSFEMGRLHRIFAGPVVKRCVKCPPIRRCPVGWRIDLQDQTTSVA
ncbi:hypothetical protein CHELA20_11118 [Hyphomicrobiales bacterium]|nr:hypothetical protein CHELA20_11118 [Hyphomicrobiales bacterium]CAH1694948.1 hypothetical protein CHELA41_51349 [Hyphomicrobiales bacterium]